MVTIIPIDVDDELVREGVALAVARRLEYALSEAMKVVLELRGNGLIERERWQGCFEQVAAHIQNAQPILEYARVFVDQWPEGDDAE